MLLPEDEEGEEIAPASHLRGAVRTIIVADFVMSLDNVIGVAGAAHGNLSLLVFGLLLSIPLVVWSSQLILHLMERWPAIVTLGGALLGWVAGGMMVTDPALTDALSGLPERLRRRWPRPLAQCWWSASANGLLVADGNGRRSGSNRPIACLDARRRVPPAGVMAPTLTVLRLHCKNAG